MNAEVFALTYGAVVKQLLTDLHDTGLVNAKLDDMGHRMGIRLVEEFLAKSRQARCSSFPEVAETLATQALHMFLGVRAQVTEWNADRTECLLVLPDNPLTEFVELPAEYRTLQYSQVLCGAIRGALEMVNFFTEVKIVKDVLHKDDTNSIRLKLLSAGTELPPFKDD